MGRYVPSTETPTTKATCLPACKWDGNECIYKRHGHPAKPCKAIYVEDAELRQMIAYDRQIDLVVNSLRPPVEGLKVLQSQVASLQQQLCVIVFGAGLLGGPLWDRCRK